jgi:isopenicillin-N N-acyltransferase like protein
VAGHYPHVRVQGAPHERGLRYGTQAASRVRRSVEAYRVVFERWTGLDWASIRRLAGAYAPSIAAFDERCLEEMRGIAQGAGLELEDILAINVRTEVMFAAKARAALHPQRPPAECTALAVLPVATAQGRILIAQNWDWLVHTRETVVVLEVEPERGPRFVTVVEAGLLAKFGLNSAGVGILTNALVCDGDLGEPGVPYHVVLRSLHEATSITDALTRLQAATRASSANYVLAHEDGLAVDVETMPGDFSRVLIVEPEGGLIAHTNHYLSPRFDAVDVGRFVMPDGVFRLQSVRESLGPRLGSVRPETLQEALSLHEGHPGGVCSHLQEDLDPTEWDATIASAVIDLRRRRVWLADGNPCTTGYRPIDYSDLLASG